MIEVESPEVSVAFAPRQLGGVDQWRFVLRRIYPKARDPLRFGLIRAVLLVGYLGFVGAFAFYLARMAESPWTLAVAGMAVGLLWPLRLWATKRSALAIWTDRETYEVGADALGLMIRTPNRVTRIRWAGVKDLLINHWDVVVRLQANDMIIIPIRAFQDEAHLGQFLDVVRSKTVASLDRKAQG